MQKVTLRNMCFNDKKIVFNEGENYIVGLNGTGKTTLFYLIQYVLGLKKSMPRMTGTFVNESISLEASFGKKSIHIERDFKSDTINFSGDINERLKASSLILGDIYNELLQSSIDKSEDRMSAIEILRVGFIGDIISPTYKESTSIFKKVLGINTALPIQMKREIEKFKKEIDLEETTDRILLNYIDNVETKLEDENSKLGFKDVEYVVNILKNEFTHMRNESSQNMLILKEAKESMNRANSYNEDLFVERTLLLEPYFYKLLSQLDVLQNRNLMNVINDNNLYSTSYGEHTLLKLAMLITLCRKYEYDWHNGSGLLVNDGIQVNLDRHRTERYRRIISDECKNGALQYIEFVQDKKTIPNEFIVFEFTDMGSLYGK